ncbi:MAG: ABC transporter ATP-binding protein [Lachnospiraceae bacterium]
MTEKNNTFLDIKNLIVEYTSEGKIVHAVNDVTLSLERGKTLALVGETGAGKTTIAKSILRILPDRGAKIKSGSITLDNKNLLKLPEPEMRKVRGARISMIFQDPMTALNPTMKVGVQISEVIKIHNEVSKGEARRRAIEMLEMVGITAERYEAYPHQFSGGMKQRVVVAMALACSPELLLADEPTTALDVTIQAQILEMIYDLKEKSNMSMLLITHDLGIVAQAADAVAVIYGGEILEYGKKEDVFDNPKHPYTVGLFKAIPDLETDARRLANIEGMPPDPTDLPKGCCFSPRCPYATEECRIQKYALKEIESGHGCNCGRISEIEKEVQHDNQPGRN